MRIGIDARFFGPVGKGLGRYTERLIQNLERVAEDHEFVVFLRKENYDAYRPSSPRFRKVLADFSWYSIAEQIRMPTVIRRERIELMHFPHFNVPIVVPCPFIVTIHDLILLRYPTLRATTLGPLLYGLKYAAYRLVIGRAVRNARRIITVSNHAKADIVSAFGIDPNRIEVTYEAADPPSPKASEDRPTVDLKTKGIVKPFFLYVGNAYPHKNLETLLSVFKTLRQNGLEAQMVLVGKRDYFYDRLEQEANRLGLTERKDVVFYGFAEDTELSELYRRTRAYVFPSLYEGFGLPPLEAMTHGAPVAASNGSCLPEILKDAVAYFPPSDPAKMAEVMRRVFSDEALRRELIDNGRARVATFSWKRCAEQTYRIYQSTLRS